MLTRYVADAPDGFRALGAREFQDWTPSVALPGAQSCRGFGFPREPVIECVVYRTMSEVDAANRFEDLIELTRAALPAWEGNRLNMFNAYFSSKNDAATIGLGVSRVDDRYDVEVSVRPAPK